MVAEEEVDPRVARTGPGGRITKGDVLAHLESTGDKPRRRQSHPSSPATTPLAQRPAATPAPSAPSGPRETRQRMSGLRQRIAQRLVEAQQTAAILTTFNEADMSRVMRAAHPVQGAVPDQARRRARLHVVLHQGGDRGAEGVSRRSTAGSTATKSSIRTSTTSAWPSAPSAGLMVPVIRDADRIAFAEIEKAIGGFAVKAREGTIAVSDLQGGTFTITNGGVFGSLLSTPILNPPQSGILGMHAIQKRPVAVDDQVVIRPMMYLALSYDHRLIDGREAVSFLVRIKECIENPERCCSRYDSGRRHGSQYRSAVSRLVEPGADR